MTPTRTWPTPARHRVLGHLPRWSFDALELLTDGARQGPVFRLMLWRPAVVGYRPDWNRFVLGDVAGFRSRGSLSQLSPYLSGGVVALDAPAHRARRAELNPSFHRRAVTQLLATPFAELAQRHLPAGEFDAVAYSSQVIRAMMTRAFVGTRFPDPTMRSFLAPLDRPLPGPLLRRPVRIARMQRALRANFAEPDPDTLAPLFAGLSDGVEEARVAIAAAYDTTAHTLAFALWELAGHPELARPEFVDGAVSETLRMYPAGWIGSRVAAADTEFDGRVIPAKRLVLYSPYLTHRDPELWPNPEVFDPTRFDRPLPAWSYIPFSAGERTCLGAALATLMLRSAIGAFLDRPLTRVSQTMTPRGALTLTPGGPILLRRGERR